MMLCDRCQSISFEPHQNEAGPGRAARDASELVCILHHDRPSFAQSLSAGCHLCTMIESRMNRTSSPSLPSGYRSLQAYVILKCTVGKGPGGLPTSLMVISLRGSFALDVIEPSRGAITDEVAPSLKRLASQRHEVFDPVTEQAVLEEVQGRRKRIALTSFDGSMVEPNKAGKSHGDGPINQMQAFNVDDTSTGSTANLALAKTWLQNCVQNHSLCSKVIAQQQIKFHPRRLINLSNPKKPFLQTTPASGIPYIALSYAWGEGYRFLTLKQNYTQHQTCLPIQKLPRTFRDALRVAEQLRISHIWIDALCIIQDEPSDLEAELPIMGDIYRHAIFTIYAEGSSSTQSGLFRDRDPIAFRPCTVNVTGLLSNPASATNLTLATTITGTDHLKSRSWCLQEEVLTSRFLCFGTQTSWRCLSSVASETRPEPQDRKTPLTDVLASDIDRLRMWLYAPAEMSTSPTRQKWFRANHFDAWYDVVQEHSVRQLRDVGDNLKALSGLAGMFARIHGGRYLAGLWGEDLKVGLGWYVALNERRVVRVVHGAPSWSWIKVGKVRLRFRGWEAHAVMIEGERVELVGIEGATGNPVNLFGADGWGSLRVRGRMWKGKVVFDREYGQYRTRAVQRPGVDRFQGFEGEDKKEHPRFPGLVMDLASDRPIAEVALDFDPAKDADLVVGREVSCLLLHVQQMRESRRFTFLVLVRSITGVDAQYTRIGLGWAAESPLTEQMDFFTSTSTEEVTII